ncbi:MAG: hypothetical protein GX323_03025 [Clostridiales bacterium]|nr:hypothetical protein [Clostridiales bacterium]
MVFINVIILGLFILLLVKSKNYEKDYIALIDKEEYKLNFLFPVGFYIYDQVGRIKNNLLFTKQDDLLRAIYVGEPIKAVKRLYMCNKIVTFGLVLFIFNILSLFSSISSHVSSDLIDNNKIYRPQKLSESKTINLDVYMTDDDILVLTKGINLEVSGRKYTSEELHEIIINAKSYIDSVLLKENISSKEITSNINLIENVPNTDLYVDWEIEDYDLITREGKVNNENISNKVDTWVNAIILYDDIEVEYKIDLTILPKMFTKEELAYKHLLEEINESDDKSSSKDFIELPTKVEGMDIHWEEKKESQGIFILFIGLILSIGTFLIYDKELYDKVKERNRQMLLDYPEIINKVTLLLGAGMPLKNAWHKIVKDYKEKETKKRYAYEEMIITSNEMMLGMSEINAYEGFGRRVKLLPYLRFSSLIAQNVKKGSSDLLNILEVEVVESYEERKELAKRIGEEAGTKLLFPMMLMLLIVLVIVIVPAFLSFQI